MRQITVIDEGWSSSAVMVLAVLAVLLVFGAATAPGTASCSQPITASQAQESRSSTTPLSTSCQNPSQQP